MSIENKVGDTVKGTCTCTFPKSNGLVKSCEDNAGGVRHGVEVKEASSGLVENGPRASKGVS